MQQSSVLWTLIAYKVVLIAIGIYASKRNQSQEDFFLGGRGLGPWVSALSASASSSSVWTLLGVSGAAYSWGLASLWLFPACLGGFMINWFLVAPRLRRHSLESGAITLTEVLAGSKKDPYFNRIAALASAIILFSLLFYVASQFQGSGKTFESAFEMSKTPAVLLGGGIIVFYTMIGGFWAVSLTDALQGSMMALTAICLPLAALIAVGGPSGLVDGIHQVQLTGFTDPIRGMALPAGFGFVLGLMGIGLGYPGQPHVVNRFMAIRDEASVNRGRQIALIWAVLVYAGMILLGLCGRVLVPDLPDNETVFFSVAGLLFHPIAAGVMIAAVLSATMSTADSQLLVAASSVTNDLPFFKPTSPVAFSRWVVLLLSAGAVLLALVGSNQIFDKVLFAWTAMGAAFGPLLLVLLFKGPVRSQARLLAIGTGFVLSVIAFSIPAMKGNAWERVFPFVVSFLIAWFSVEENQNPNKVKAG